MDRPITKKPSKLKKYWPQATIVAAILAVLLGFSLTDLSTLRIKRDEVRIAKVQKGEFLVKVIGSGVVMPSDIEFVMPKSSAEVVEVLVESGDAVEVGQPLFTFLNEELLADLAAKELQLAESKASLSSRTFELDAQEINLESDALQRKSEFNVSQAKYLALAELMKLEVPPVSLLDFREAKIRAEQLEKQWQLADRRLRNFQESKNVQLEQFRVKIAVAESMLNNTQEKVDALDLSARKKGIIQEVTLEPGQRVDVGSILAKIVNPDKVHIRLKIPALQINKLKQGQAATVTANQKTLYGTVSRIDPNVTGATVDVDVELSEKYDFLRPNMHVLGEIEVFKLPNTLYVEKLANAIENGSAMVYVVDQNGSNAKQTKVELGEFSSQHVQILSGVNAGDELIVSDMSKAKAEPEVILN